MAVLDLPNEKILEICDIMDDQTLGHFIQSNSRIYQICWDIFETRRRNKIVPHHTVKLTRQLRQFLLKIYENSVQIYMKNHEKSWSDLIEQEKGDSFTFIEWEPHSWMNDWDTIDSGPLNRTVIEKGKGIGVIVIHEPFKRYIKIMSDDVSGGISIINVIRDDPRDVQYTFNSDRNLGYEILEIYSHMYKISAVKRRRILVESTKAR